MFDGTPQSVSAQQHIDKMTTFFDLYEIDEEDVTIRLFVQTFGGEVRKWFRGLTARSIPTLDDLQKQFLDRREIRKDPLQINAEYNNLKRNHGESIQDYIIRFNTVYNAIPDDLRPSRKSALLKFPDGFDPEMAYSLRDRDPPTLEDMQKIVVSVEANLNDKRSRMKVESESQSKKRLLHQISSSARLKGCLNMLILTSRSRRFAIQISEVCKSHSIELSSVKQGHKRQ